MDLDKTDAILFDHLLSNARISVKELAKAIGKSKATVVKRIKHLEEGQYILRYDGIINWQKLPFIKKVYFIKTSKEASLVAKLINNRSVFSIITLSGIYNLQVWCFFLDELQQEAFESLLKEPYMEVTITKLTFPRVSFFDIPVNISESGRSTRKDDLKLSSIDIKILKHMAQGHGRDSILEISRTLKTPYDSTHYHLNALLRNGYFTAIIAQPGTNKWTLQTTCLIIKCRSKQSANALYTMLQKTQRIISNAIGENILLVHFLSKTHIEYRETLSTIMAKQREDIEDLVITHWEKVMLNNRYPLEHLLHKK